MKNQYFKKSFSVEWLKIKGLGLIHTAVLLALLLPLLHFGISLFSEDARQNRSITMGAAEFYLETNLMNYGSFFLLLFIILAASRICQTDHKNNGWTFLETQPLSKLSIYGGKFLTVFVLAFISITCFLLFNLIF